MLRMVPPWRGFVIGAVLLLMPSPTLADYTAGLAAFSRKDYSHAFSEWIEGAKAGDAHAQHGIGMLYELGQGVPDIDPKAAADWYQKAAAQNYAPALNNLARLYADGRGVKQDVPKAIELWLKAADAGNVTARFNLGLQYASGSGVPQDMKKAAEYMLLAAESGLPEAQFAIAGYYRDGTGVEKNLETARLWYDRAATAGFEPARSELAALNKPAVSPAPAAESGAAPSVQGQQTQAQKMEAPAAPLGANTKPADQPAPEGDSQQGTPNDPAKEPEQPQTSIPTEPPPQPAETAQPPGAPPAGDVHPEDLAAQGVAEASPAVESGAGSDLPIAESLTGDARVYRIWLYTSGQEGDARSYWNKLTMQFPGLLKPLDLDLRRYFLGEAKGSLYRVFAGPFEGLGAAQKACEDIRQRLGDQFCRPVLN